jgi:hypothetical protein
MNSATARAQRNMLTSSQIFRGIESPKVLARGVVGAFRTCIKFHHIQARDSRSENETTRSKPGCLRVVYCEHAG